MTFERARKILPGWLLAHVYHFETMIEEGVERFAAGLPAGSLVLDAGAGESRHAALFEGKRYVGVDLGVGDATWDYRRLDALADLEHLPFGDGVFDGALMIVTIEHLKEPGAALCEIARVMKSGGQLFLVAPHQWEVHQAPHDYYRYTRHGLEYLLGKAGMRVERVDAAGGLFRLLSRRLLTAVTLAPGWLKPLALIAFAPPALVLPWLDGFDGRQDFTLGYSCTATKL